ncbi:hypothetical protein GYMLUDRAFT_78403 [Collybiopsis luxurians FD-317 M1]|uniref:Uncharacterized protein n=1 Tax=Collybiopsis luxurians FD-317 M1 TaxID=944289 RepID=A0A0D0C7S5_9AGAR|nr:hypothetical protein GYMLUDRAFT_78403 [Collybiopsis luxurians FD-317 M1]
MPRFADLDDADIDVKSLLSDLEGRRVSRSDGSSYHQYQHRGRDPGHDRGSHCPPKAESTLGSSFSSRWEQEQINIGFQSTISRGTSIRILKSRSG